MKKIFLMSLVVAILAACQMPGELVSSQAETARSALTQYDSIPLVVVLYPRIQFEGSSILLVGDTPDLAIRKFSSMASSAAVMRGPSYDTYKAAYGEPSVTLFTGTLYSGKVMKLQVGLYPTLQNIPNNGGISNQTVKSIDFNAANVYLPAEASSDSDDTFASIPLVVEVYENKNYGGKYQLFVAQDSNFVVTTKRFGVTPKTGVPVGFPVVLETRTWDRNSDAQAFLNTNQTWSIFGVVVASISNRELHNFSDAVYESDTSRNLNNAVSSIVVAEGPDYSAGKQVYFYDGNLGSGTSWVLGAGDYPDVTLVNSNMNDKISAISFP